MPATPGLRRIFSAALPAQGGAMEPEQAADTHAGEAAVYDVGIVGGGPAGATAALCAARRGLSAIVLEACPVPRRKLCGGLLSRKTMDIVKRLYHASAADLMERGIINYSSAGYEIHFGGSLLCCDRYDYPFHFTERAVFDAWLLEEARRAGAAVRTGTPVRAADIDAGVLKLGDGGTVRCRYIVGADGANSVVRRAFGVDRRRWSRGVASTVEVRIPRSEYPRCVEHPEVHVGPVPEGYGWVFPNRDAVVVGLGGRPAEGQNLARLFRDFLQTLGVRDVSGMVFRGHPLPLGNPLGKLTRGRGLLAGDAGGLVEPVFGEGIYFAIRSGEAAAQSVAQALHGGASIHSGYAGALRRDVCEEIAGSRRMQRLIFLLDRNGLNPLVKWGIRRGRRVLLDVIHGRRSFQFFRKLA